MQKALYTVSGKVIQGMQYGQRLGFPTANLDREEYQKNNMHIPFGVYAGIATVSGKEKAYQAGIVIGPADESGLPKIEAHLLDFSADLYGEKLFLSLVCYLRPYSIFKSEDSLKRTIANDLEKVRAAITL